MPRKIKPPPAIDEKLAELLTKGGLAPIVLENLDHSTAASLRHRLYRERIKMRVVAHPDVETANKATIILQVDKKHEHMFCLVVYPANLLIEAALERAGITSNDPPPLD